MKHLIPLALLISITVATPSVRQPEVRGRQWKHVEGALGYNLFQRIFGRVPVQGPVEK